MEPDVHRAGLHRRSNTLSFELFGVGVRQARLVSELTGFASVLLLALGVSAGSAAAQAGAHRRRAARDQLRLRDVRTAPR